MKVSDIRGVATSSPIEEVKHIILRWFKERNCSAGHVIGKKDLFHLTMTMNPKQKDAIDDALKALEDEGVIEEHKNGMALTNKGVNVIY